MGFMPLADFAAGFLAGCAQVIVGQPLDYIKIKLQVAEGKKSIIDCAKQIVAQHGLRGFYRGSSSIFMGIGGAIALEFSVYESAKRQLRKYLKIGVDDQLPLPYIGIAGLAVGFATVSLYCPMQYTKIILQTQKHSQYKGSAQAVWHILWQQGFFALYKGYLVTLLRDVPGCWMYYVPYEAALLTLSSGREHATSFHYLAAGSMAGVSYWTFAYPFDRIKTKVQSGSSYAEALRSSLNLFKLYRGFSVVLMRCVPVNSVNFFIYETVQKWFKKHRYLQE